MMSIIRSSLVFLVVMSANCCYGDANLADFCSDWLYEGPSQYDYNHDSIINFIDFSMLPTDQNYPATPFFATDSDIFVSHQNSLNDGIEHGNGKWYSPYNQIQSALDDTKLLPGTTIWVLNDRSYIFDGIDQKPHDGSICLLWDGHSGSSDTSRVVMRGYIGDGNDSKAVLDANNDLYRDLLQINAVSYITVKSLTLTNTNQLGRVDGWRWGKRNIFFNRTLGKTSNGVIIDNCLFENYSRAIEDIGTGKGGPLTVKNCVIHLGRVTTDDYCIMLASNVSVVFENNIFNGTGRAKIFKLISASPSPAVFTNNTFRCAVNAFQIGTGTVNITLMNNIICDIASNTFENNTPSTLVRVTHSGNIYHLRDNSNGVFNTQPDYVDPSSDNNKTNGIYLTNFEGLGSQVGLLDIGLSYPEMHVYDPNWTCIMRDFKGWHMVPLGLPGSFDDSGFREQGNILYDPNGGDRTYAMTYTGYQGTYVAGDTLSFVGAAFSRDGINWTRYGQLLTLPSEDPYIVKVGDTYHLYYEDKTRIVSGGHLWMENGIGHAISTDLVNWTYDPDPNKNRVFGMAPGWESQDTSSPVVWVEDGKWYMLYEGRGSNNPGQIGLAWSDDGLNWTRSPANPIIVQAPHGQWDDAACVPDDIRKINGVYWIIYHGIDSGVPGRSRPGIVYTTKPPIEWTRADIYREPRNPMFFSTGSPSTQGIPDGTVMFYPGDSPFLAALDVSGLGISRFIFVNDANAPIVTPLP